MPTAPETVRIIDLIRSFAAEQQIPVEDGTRPGELVLTLPGEHKLNTSCSLIVSESRLSISAFVIRRPDENHMGVYAYLLRRNLSLPGLAYAIDRVGDVFLTGGVPLGAVDEAYLDQLLGVVLAGSDEVFNELLVLGFLSSMRREWSWRTSREESLANLEPFRDILESDDDAGRDGAAAKDGPVASAEETAEVVTEISPGASTASPDTSDTGGEDGTAPATDHGTGVVEDAETRSGGVERPSPHPSPGPPDGPPPEK